MADKIASGAWHAGGPTKPQEPQEQRSEEDRLTSRRDSGRWYAVIGFAMLFAAGFNAGFAIGGVLMIGYGVTASFYWSTKLRRLKGDPWAYDPELDGAVEGPFFRQ